MPIDTTEFLAGTRGGPPLREARPARPRRPQQPTDFLQRREQRRAAAQAPREPVTTGATRQPRVSRPTAAGYPIREDFEPTERPPREAAFPPGWGRPERSYTPFWREPGERRVTLPPATTPLTPEEERERELRGRRLEARYEREEALAAPVFTFEQGLEAFVHGAASLPPLAIAGVKGLINSAFGGRELRPYGEAMEPVRAERARREAITLFGREVVPAGGERIPEEFTPAQAAIDSVSHDLGFLASMYVTTAGLGRAVQAVPLRGPAAKVVQHVDAVVRRTIGEAPAMVARAGAQGAAEWGVVGGVIAADEPRQVLRMMALGGALRALGAVPGAARISAYDTAVREQYYQGLTTIVDLERRARVANYTFPPPTRHIVDAWSRVETGKPLTPRGQIAYEYGRVQQSHTWVVAAYKAGAVEIPKADGTMHYVPVRGETLPWWETPVGRATEVVGGQLARARPTRALGLRIGLRPEYDPLAAVRPGLYSQDVAAAAKIMAETPRPARPPFIGEAGARLREMPASARVRGVTSPREPAVAPVSPPAPPRVAPPAPGVVEPAPERAVRPEVEVRPPAAEAPLTERPGPRVAEPSEVVPPKTAVEIDRFVDREVAERQRGDAESAMVKVAFANGGGVLNPVVENAGDLIHRMTESPTRSSGGFEAVSEKVPLLLRALTHEYGFAREAAENVTTNARATGMGREAFQSRLDAALSKYTEAHRAITPYNEVQRLANDVAIAIGEGRYPAAIESLRTLDAYLKEGREAWTARAHEFEMPAAEAPRVPTAEEVLTPAEQAEFGRGVGPPAEGRPAAEVLAERRAGVPAAERPAEARVAEQVEARRLAEVPPVEEEVSETLYGRYEELSNRSISQPETVDYQAEVVPLQERLKAPGELAKLSEEQQARVIDPTYMMADRSEVARRSAIAEARSIIERGEAAPEVPAAAVEEPAAGLSSNEFSRLPREQQADYAYESETGLWMPKEEAVPTERPVEEAAPPVEEVTPAPSPEAPTPPAEAAPEAARRPTLRIKKGAGEPFDVDKVTARNAAWVASDGTTVTGDGHAEVLLSKSFTGLRGAVSSENATAQGFMRVSRGRVAGLGPGEIGLELERSFVPAHRDRILAITDRASEQRPVYLDITDKGVRPHPWTIKVTSFEQGEQVLRDAEAKLLRGKYTTDAEAAAERIRNRRAQRERGAAGLGPRRPREKPPRLADDLRDYMMVGVDLIARGIRSFGKWSREMIKRVGEGVRPFLRQIWNRATGQMKRVESDVISGAAARLQQRLRLGKTLSDPDVVGDLMRVGRTYMDQGFTGFDGWARRVRKHTPRVSKGQLRPIYKRLREGEIPPEDVGDKLARVIRRAAKLVPERAAEVSALRARQAAGAAVALEKYTGGEAFRRALAAMRGEAGKPTFEAVEGEFSPEDVEVLKERIRKTDAFHPNAVFARTNAYIGLMKLLGGEVPVPSELTKLEAIFGPGLVRAARTQIKTAPNALRIAVDVANIPRALVASVDFSGSLRQAVMMVPRYPKQWLAAMREQFRVVLSERNMQALQMSIAADPMFELAETAEPKLYIAPWGEAAALSEREEEFTSRIAERIPIIGPVIRASNRAMVGLLNKLRFDIFKKRVEALGPEATAEEIGATARFINHFTARGSLGKAEPLSAELAVGLFSPRFFVSRIQALADTVRGPKRVRREAAKTLSLWIASTLSLLALADISGIGEVEWNLRSSDSIKLRIGNTRIDPWGGYQQIVRYLMQFITGESKHVETKRISRVRPPAVASRFLRSKLAPATALGWDIAEGFDPESGVLLKDFLGREMRWDEEGIKLFARTKLTPIAIQDIVELYQEENGFLASSASVAAILGTGIVSYPPKGVAEGERRPAQIRPSIIQPDERRLP